jgi:hypothetical protein
MSTIDPPQPTTDASRTVAIDFLFLDMSTCTRCRGTGDGLEAALAAVDGVMRATGAEAVVRRIHVRSLEQARELRFVSSPTIRVNGSDIAPDLLESECGDGACGCGGGATCRVWTYGGRRHNEAPAGLIVDAILGELYGRATLADTVTEQYEVPDNLVRVFEQTERSGGGCCG